MKTKKLMKSSVLKYALLSALGMFIFCPSLRAQKVTIGPNTGKLIGAKSYDSGNDYEVGLGRGQSAMWRHNQLPLTFTTSDGTALTSDKLLSVHANNLKFDQGYLVIVGTDNSYFELSLPKGYRFTSYKIVLNDVYNEKFSGANVDRQKSTFAENSSDFKTTLSDVVTIPATMDPSSPDYIVTRTAGTKSDMSNELYFHLNSGGSGMRTALRVKSFEVTFECDNEFNATVAPTTANGTGVSVAAANPFATGKQDLGEVKYQEVLTERRGTTWATAYSYTNVKDLYANNLLYESNAVNDSKVADATKGNKTIYSVKSGDNYYYGLKPNTYYIETPTSTTDQSGKEVPLGYRITGAKIHYAFGDVTKTDGFYIKYTSYNTNYYLNTSGQFVEGTTSDAALWSIDADGYISSNEYYLGYYGDNYYLATTKKKSEANQFKIDDNNRIYFIDDYSYKYYLSSYYTNPNFSYYTDNAATAVAKQVTVAGKPYTITAYGIDGKTSARTKTLNAASDNGTITLSGLNNDAVKLAQLQKSVDRCQPTTQRFWLP